jgi:hypothetical protein
MDLSAMLRKKFGGRYRYLPENLIPPCTNQVYCCAVILASPLLLGH